MREHHAPKSMISAEEKEHGMSKVKKFGMGGLGAGMPPGVGGPPGTPMPPRGGPRGVPPVRAPGRPVGVPPPPGGMGGMAMKKGGKAGKEEPKKEKKFAKGGHIRDDGTSTQAHSEPMRAVKVGGKRAHGEHSIQERGHTKAKEFGMSRGGKC